MQSFSVWEKRLAPCIEGILFEKELFKYLFSSTGIRKMLKRKNCRYLEVFLPYLAKCFDQATRLINEAPKSRVHCKNSALENQTVERLPIFGLDFIKLGELLETVKGFKALMVKTLMHTKKWVCTR